MGEDPRESQEMVKGYVYESRGFTMEWLSDVRGSYPTSYCTMHTAEWSKVPKMGA
jgi:hypothetical protein